MRDYELVVLLPVDGKEEGTLSTVAKTVEQNKGKVAKVDKWGVRPLAYPVGKQKEAHYFRLFVSFEPDGVGEAERTLRVNEDILRYLLVKKEGGGKVVPERPSQDKKVDESKKREKVATEAKKKTKGASVKSAKKTGGEKKSKKK